MSLTPSPRYRLRSTTARFRGPTIAPPDPSPEHTLTGLPAEIRLRIYSYLNLHTSLRYHHNQLEKLIPHESDSDALASTCKLLRTEVSNLTTASISIEPDADIRYLRRFQQLAPRITSMTMEEDFPGLPLLVHEDRDIWWPPSIDRATDLTINELGRVLPMLRRVQITVTFGPHLVQPVRLRGLTRRYLLHVGRQLLRLHPTFRDGVLTHMDEALVRAPDVGKVSILLEA